MPVIEDQIIKIVEDKEKTLGWLAGQIGMSRAGFNKMLESETIKVSTLQKIADVLKVPVSDFFEMGNISSKKTVTQEDIYDGYEYYKAQNKILVDRVLDIITRSAVLNKENIITILNDTLKEILQVRNKSIAEYKNEWVEEEKKINEIFSTAKGLASITEAADYIEKHIQGEYLKEALMAVLDKHFKPNQ